MSGEAKPEGGDDSRPLLRVLTPNTTPEEIAAIVAVLAAVGSSEAPARRPVSQWASYRRRLTPVVPNGPGAWRGSALPR